MPDDTACIFPCVNDLISGVDLDGNGSIDYIDGVGVYSGAIVNIGFGNISSKQILVDLDGGEFDISEYTYDYFTDRVEGFDGMGESGSPLTQAGLVGAATTVDGYRVIKRQSYTEISNGGSPINIGSEKIILFVEGDLGINDEIHLDKGEGFFMAIVNGNINIHPSVGDAYNWVNDDDTDPELEGIYVTTSDGAGTSDVGNIETGSNGVDSDDTLEVRGVVTALGGEIILQRDLPDDSTTPAEKFYYGADQTLLLPQFFGQHVYRWKEVAP
jgi:hypothetical protein